MELPGLRRFYSRRSSSRCTLPLVFFGISSITETILGTLYAAR